MKPKSDFAKITAKEIAAVLVILALLVPISLFVGQEFRPFAATGLRVQATWSDASGRVIQRWSSTIQGAIDWLPSTGGEIYIPPGTYITSGLNINKERTTLTLASGANLTLQDGNITISADYVTIEGNGFGSLINIADTSFHIDPITSDGADYLTIRRLRINGQKTGATDSMDGIYFASGRHIHIDHVWVGNVTRHGINVGWTPKTALYPRITHSIVCDAGWNGITTYDSGGAYIAGNYITRTSDVAISAYGENHTITGNTIEDCNEDNGSVNSHWGIAVEAEGALTDGPIVISDNNVLSTHVAVAVWGADLDVIIANNIINNCSFGIRVYTNAGLKTLIQGNSVYNVLENHIRVQHARVQIIGNALETFYGPSANARSIHMVGASDTYIASNMIVDMDLRGTGVHGYDSTNVTVVNNVIYGTTAAIRKSGAGEKWQVSGNRIVSNSQDAISLSASNNSYITDNYIDSPGQDGIDIESNSDNCTISDNFIRHVPSGYYPIRVATGLDNTVVLNNDIRENVNAIADLGTDTLIEGNRGYNPKGLISNPVSGSKLVDSGTETIANNTVYTCRQSPKMIYLTTGSGLADSNHYFQIWLDETALISTVNDPGPNLTYSIHLEYGQTFRMVYKQGGVFDIRVFGE